MRSDWFCLLLITFSQMIHCSLQTKTKKKAVLWQGNRTYRTMLLLNSIRIEIYSGIVGFSLR